MEVKSSWCVRFLSKKYRYLTVLHLTYPPPPQCCILAAQTAVGIQRVRVETDHEINDMPMQIFIDNDEPFELANGESTTILLNNGDHVAYAVIDNIESDTISFKTSYKTMIIAITPERNMFGNISLKIEAYEYK